MTYVAMGQQDFISRIRVKLGSSVYTAYTLPQGHGVMDHPCISVWQNSGNGIDIYVAWADIDLSNAVTLQYVAHRAVDPPSTWQGPYTVMTISPSNSYSREDRSVLLQFKDPSHFAWSLFRTHPDPSDEYTWPTHWQIYMEGLGTFVNKDQDVYTDGDPPSAGYTAPVFSYHVGEDGAPDSIAAQVFDSYNEYDGAGVGGNLNVYSTTAGLEGAITSNYTNSSPTYGGFALVTTQIGTRYVLYDLISNGHLYCVKRTTSDGNWGAAVQLDSATVASGTPVSVAVTQTAPPSAEDAFDALLDGSNVLHYNNSGSSLKVTSECITDDAGPFTWERQGIGAWGGTTPGNAALLYNPDGVYVATKSCIFDDFNDGDYAGWGANGGWSAATGAMKNTTQSGWSWFYRSQTPANADMQLSYCWNTAATGGRMYVRPRCLSNANSDRVELVVYPSWMWLRQFVNGVMTDFGTWNTTSTQDTWYDLRVVCDGASVQVWKGPKGGTMTLVKTISNCTMITSDYAMFISVDSIWSFDDIYIEPLD
ncbi:MAG: hypothetical protein HZB26_25360 [Candidatus Hydrogenedentes bacterium]|nr:hypothetical protein [Candidatus Hydrogenedentota bacterium]